MKCLLFSLPHFHFPFYIFLALIHLPPSSSDNKQWYRNCSVLSNCGSITGVDYPFWGSGRPQNCGYPGLKLRCDENILMIEIMNIEYRVLAIDQETKNLKIVRKDFMGGICLKEFVNTTLNYSLLDYASGYENLTLLYGCQPSLLTIPGKFTCPINGLTYEDGYVELGNGFGEFGIPFPVPCQVSVSVPISSSTSLLQIGNLSSLNQVIEEGFEVELKVDSTACSKCKKLNGQCGYDLDLNQFACLCPNQTTSGSRTCTGTKSTADDERSSLQSPPDDERSSPQSPPSASASGNGGVRNNVPLTVGLGIAGAAIFGIGLGWCIFSCRQKRKRLAAQTVSKDLPTPPSSKGLSLTTPRTNFSQSIPSYPSLSSKNSDLEKGSTYFGVQVFSYTELEEATDNFNPSRELGDGGFGTVYFGKLHDDRIVAVKRLYENNFKRVEQFMNEVEILTRLRHQNLVTLYGCTSKRSRELLLVYEYIPNGTVADHLHGKRANSGLLSWPVRLSIAIETADALAFLHASDVIHRDVKTNNILLDNDFRVKVADFGLSRLFPTNATHVSTAPQGTPGYVDPEYYQCYQLTDKSDVYSFGVVLIELISSKQAVDTNRHRHDINLANMAVNKIQNHTLHELVDPTLGFETNSSVRRMTTLVAELAFRCLQQEKDVRPSMEEVLEALKEIKTEESSVQKAEVVDIMVDDVGLLKVTSPPMSPDSAGTEKWVSTSTTPNSSG